MSGKTTSSNVDAADHQTATETPSTEQPPLFTGSCFCKTITFTLSCLPIKSYICHCLDCRRITSTSFAHNIAFPFSCLTISTNTNRQSSDGSAANPTTNVDDILSTFGDLKSGRRQFCRLCGSGLFLYGKVAEGEETREVIVQAGVIDGSHEDERLKPVAEGFCKRREGWMDDMKGTEVFEEW